MAAENGETVVQSTAKVQAELEGPAEFMGFGTDEPLPTENFMDHARTLYDGRALLARYPGKKLGLVGESGGGTMILVTALMAKARGVQMPACIVPFSPCTNLAEDLPSRKRNKGALIVSYSNVIELLNGVYLTPDTDARDPFVSPFFGDYTGFPPMYFFADEGEVLFDDTDLLVPKLKAAGVEVQYEIMKGKFHSFPTLGRSCPESKAYLDDTKAFLRQYLA